ncbi:MAG TPA: ATP-binding protein, partial [Opitutaceae bacterium]|nr:ATP-binding protein [Opitutaceae bacterium]
VHTPAGTAVAIAAGVEPDGGRAFLAVADRGPGVAVEERERIFRKFLRGESARTGGLGLGLSIVRGFTVAQGGAVDCRENPGGGAVFTIYLPHRTPQGAPEP